MRYFSLPFDWVYMVDSRPLIYLCEGFANDFANLALYSNLKREPASGTHKIIYSDTYSGYIFPNHFSYVLTEHVYQDFYCKLRRRCCRLIEKINSSKNILFILTLTFDVDNNIIFKLYDSICSQFNKNIDFQVMVFGVSDNNIIKYKGLTLLYINRKMNDYDFYKTNFEWSFLDNIKLSHNYIDNKNKTYSVWTKLFGKKIQFSINISDYKKRS